MIYCSSFDLVLCSTFFESLYHNNLSKSFHEQRCNVYRFAYSIFKDKSVISSLPNYLRVKYTHANKKRPPQLYVFDENYY